MLHNECNSIIYIINKMKNKRILLSAAFLIMNAASALAQTKVQTGIESATSQITGLFDTCTKLMYAVCAILAIIGAFNVYNKWTSGDPDVTKSAAGWFGGMIFVGVAATVIRAAFL